MASVSSLDKDLRRLRLDKYTPAAANEARQWVEDILGERLPAGDLLEALKDGVALCKLVNLAVGPPGVKFKKSAMPFVQMENISHFLRASQAPPLNLQQHDMFLTVDLYEQKDPAQVLQCLGAFSRAANSVNPSAFPTPIGPRSARAGVLSPEATGPTTPTGLRGRGVSNASSNTSSSVYGRPPVAPARTGDSASGRWSPTKSPTQPAGASSPPAPVSSWSKREHEGATSPAWNIAQYGYLGGASQGNLGIAFGGRRQITSAGPSVPSFAEKEKRRKEKEAEAERQRQEEERQRQAELEAEEERARLEEERRFEEETRRQREDERRRLEEEKRRWEEEEREWRLTEETRRREEEEANARLEAERRTARKSNPQLRGQFLSQYQAEQETPDKARIRELEQQLEQARQREASYEKERQGRSLRPGTSDGKKARSRSRSRAAQPVSRQDSWSVRDERNFIASQRPQHHPQLEQHEEEVEEPALSPARLASPRPLPNPAALPPPAAKVKAHRTGEGPPPPLPIRSQHTGSRPLPDPGASQPVQQHYQQPQQQLEQPAPALPVRKQHTGSRPLPEPFEPAAPPTPVRKQHTGSRPLPNPTTYSSSSSPEAPRQQRHQPPPQQQQHKTFSPPPPQHQTFSPPPPQPQQQQQQQQRFQPPKPSPTSPPAAPPKKMSLLEREMELERQRQREWEDAQRETAATAAAQSADGGTNDHGIDGIGGGIGGRWDVSQWTGFTGGDSQNRGAQGIGAGRRQIVGPRPLPNPPR
ncbi:hypothetical protein B0J18DRAFT_175850 [Chaetomium sp. MPI-SDFR-AT-0129]|nr:hypothetical protein B0J18DRAFT_175850 [Chaetomium sp. MPI-SDFR-AT-0129]